MKRVNGGEKKKNSWGLWGAAAALAALYFIARYFLDFDVLLKNALESVRDLRAWAPFIFILLYITATVLFLPGAILTLGAGVVFGVLWGSVWVSIASTLGAGAAFLVGRYFARETIEQKISGNKKFEAVNRAVGNEGWKIVLLTRLSPVFPFNLLNYAFGLTRVKFAHYFFASWIGMIPGTIMYVYVGSLAGDIATIGAGGRQRTAGEWVFYAVGLAATVIVTIYVTRVAKKALDHKIPERENT